MNDGRVVAAYPLVSLREARRRVAELPLRPPRVVPVPVVDALGLRAARSLESPGDVPRYPTAAMDGYAVAFRRGDRPLRFAYVSRPRRGRLRPGHATPVATGHALPRGTTAVARSEATRRVGRWIRLSSEVPAGQDIHLPGEAIRHGTVLVRAREPVDPYALSALLASGRRRVPVLQVRVTVLATGSELVRSGARRRGPVDSIGPWVTSVAGQWASVRYGGVVADDPMAICRAVDAAARAADLVVTIGGSSIGPRDFTKRAVAAAGELVFGGTRVNVLKRAGVGRVRGTPVLILPGQIESAVVAFHEYGLAILGRLLGVRLAESASLPLARSFRVARRMDSTILFAERDGRAVPLGWGVARYANLLRARAFGYFPRGRTYRRGERVLIQRLLRGSPAVRRSGRPVRAPAAGARRPRRR